VDAIAEVLVIFAFLHINRFQTTCVDTPRCGAHSSPAQNAPGFINKTGAIGILQTLCAFTARWNAPFLKSTRRPMRLRVPSGEMERERLSWTSFAIAASMVRFALSRLLRLITGWFQRYPNQPKNGIKKRDFLPNKRIGTPLVQRENPSKVDAWLYIWI